MDIEIKADVVAVQGLPQQLSVARAGRQSAGTATGEGPSPLAEQHIVVVGIHYAPEPTGVAPSTTAICEYLATRARLVTVLTGLPHYPQWQVPAAYRGFRRNPEQHTPALHVIRHKHFVPSRMTSLGRSAYQATFVRRVIRTELDEKPDLVLGIVPSSSGATAAARIARRHGVPLVLLVHDLTGRLSNASNGEPADSRAAARAEQKALQAARTVLIFNESLRAGLLGAGVAEDRIVRINDWARRRPSALSPVEARRRLGWPAGRFTVVHAGEIGFAQGLSTAVEAAAELSRRDEPVDLVLVGDGPQRRALEVMAKGLTNVRFVRRPGEDEYPLVLAAADLLLLCERDRMDPGPAARYLTAHLSAGRPVLASVPAAGRTARDLAQVPAGVQIVPPGQGWPLADAIAILRLSDERRASMGSANQAFAVEHLSASVALARIEQSLAHSTD